MGFKPSVLRVPVFGLGCAGGVAGLSIGARLARAAPGEVVLVVAVELCTLAFRSDRGAKADVISSGAVRRRRRGGGAARRAATKAALRIGATAEHTWPGTLDIMGWTVDPVGFGVVLSRSLPRFVEQRLAAPVRRFVKSAQLAAPQFICHPGGAKVLDAIETALELQKGTLRDEREVLRGHGNMSAPTVLFVLERALKRGLRGSAVLVGARARLHREFSRARGQRMIPKSAPIMRKEHALVAEGAWLVAFLIVQRLAELGLAQWNTRGCGRPAASNSAPRIIR